MDFRIPVVQVTAQLHFPDGSVMSGTVFIPASSPDHSGRMRVGEWLNSSEPFFPFQNPVSSTSVLINKSNILSLSVVHEPDMDGFDEVQLVPQCKVRLFMSHSELEGGLIMEMPENRLRVLDVLNHEQPFLFLLEGEREVHVNKNFIFRVTEIKE